LKALTALAASMVLWLCGAGHGMAEPKLNVLCGVDEAWCLTMQRAFEAKAGLEISMVRKSTGEILDQIRAERSDPTVDVWWGGTGDTHLQAGSEGLLEEYTPVHQRDLLPWAQNFYAMSGSKSAGIYAGALGFAYNSELLAKNNLPAPTCWKDLAKDIYRGHILTGNPNYSGTAFTMLATLVQLFGEEEAFGFMAKLNQNVVSYTKVGAAPVKAAARGEIVIGISFMHDAVTQKISIVKGNHNDALAQAFVEFALSPEGQATGAKAGQNQVPSNARATLPLTAPDISMIKMVDYDFATFGQPEERSRLLSRFDSEIHPSQTQ